ncbi:hypothetical protein HY612_02125, partial [Candidatus Roizmanbacteria bacterium]|nr:hypothetical protein [Candidatus Roizmanbacteria bacterium]
MKNTVVGFINKPKNYINRIDKNTFVTNSGLLFYLLVWYLNPSNKLLVVFSLVLLIAIQLKLKDLSLSALLIFVITSIFLVGKSYIIQLYDLKAYPDLKIIYPFGLISQVTISISDVFFLLFAAALLIDCLKKKIIIRKLISVDILLLLFVIYGIFADVLSSKRFFFSLFLKKSIFEYALVYFYLRFWAKNINNFFSSFFSLIPVIVFFQSFVSIQQFLQSSPLGKNVEFNHGITTFGVVPDEINFVFRPIGTFDHANSLGIYLSSFLPFILLGVIINKSYLFAVSFLFGITTLLLSLSRSAWLAFFISLIGFLYYF